MNYSSNRKPRMGTSTAHSRRTERGQPCPRWVKPTLELAFFCVFAKSFATEQIFIRANQIGYSPGEPKNAIAFSDSALKGGFKLIDLTSGKDVFGGHLEPFQGVKWGTNEHHAELDFSRFNKEGRYQLQIGEARSLPFAIRKNVYTQMPDELLEFMREQRCGYNPWLDAVCHPYDGRTAFGPHTNRSEERRVGKECRSRW